MDPRLLREATRAEHEATEATMPLMDPGLTREVYCRVLVTLAPLVRSWERWAAEAAPPALQPLLPRRQRSPWLEQDLAFFGLPPEPPALAQEPAAEPVNWQAVLGQAGSDGGAQAASFLGALYVMEGSTLGGRFIARHVEGALGLQPGQGDAYFSGHGEATGSLWREVTAQIAAVPEAMGPVVIEAAKRTFQAFGAAMDAAR